jgi:hypothetical protein
MTTITIFAMCNLHMKVGLKMEIPHVDGDFDGVDE